MSKITDEEESKSQNTAIPSEVLRSALKIAFIYAHKYRHVMLISKDRKLQQLSETQKMMCVDYDGLEKFFQEQQTIKQQALSKKHTN